jgi:hypothetical protein
MHRSVNVRAMSITGPTGAASYRYRLRPTNLALRQSTFFASLARHERLKDCRIGTGMSWIEIIAQLDEEIGRLQRARDFLAGTAASSKAAPNAQARRSVPAKRKKKQQARKQTVPAVNGLEKQETAPPQQLPEIQRVPPKRRIERRVPPESARAEKAPVALRSAVPSGPVVVSADEVRKAQERSANAASSQIPPYDVSSAIGPETNFGALVRAAERNSRQNEIGTTL